MTRERNAPGSDASGPRRLPAGGLHPHLVGQEVAVALAIAPHGHEVAHAEVVVRQLAAPVAADEGGVLVEGDAHAVDEEGVVAAPDGLDLAVVLVRTHQFAGAVAGAAAAAAVV